MLVSYQLAKYGILIILQMACKKRGKKEEGKNNGKSFSNFPFPLQLRNCHNDFFK
jgi:hypothetical protein